MDIKGDFNMPVYKDEERKTWFVRTYVKGWKGKKQQKMKRGFTTRREAVAWEAEMQNQTSADFNMKLKDFVKLYFEDKENELKTKSVLSKTKIIEKHILPIFGECRMNEIMPSDIIKFQKEKQSMGYKNTYLRCIDKELRALYSHATKIYGLKENPCSKVKQMGKTDAEELDFWEMEEFSKFIDTFQAGEMYHVLFDLLFWTGCREGEALALTIDDIDCEERKIRISKTYARIEREDLITTPKTQESNRKIVMPQFLAEELREYCSRLYKFPKNERIFPITAKAVQNVMARHEKKAGVRHIRVHDLRHSYAAMLIYEGVDVLFIKKQLGHKDVRITLNTYGHLYDKRNTEVTDILEKKHIDRKEDENDK